MTRSIIILFLSTLVFSSPVYAYIGPGIGLGTIGTLIAVVVALILLAVGFIWYPLKRLLRNRKAADNKEEGDT